MELGVIDIIAIVVCTAAINLASIFVVSPIASYVYNWRLHQMKIRELPLPDEYGEVGQCWYTTVLGRSRCIPKKAMGDYLTYIKGFIFVLISVALLGYLGFIAGLLGFTFLAIPLNLRGISGCLAFCGASFLAATYIS